MININEPNYEEFSQNMGQQAFESSNFPSPKYDPFGLSSLTNEKQLDNESPNTDIDIPANNPINDKDMLSMENFDEVFHIDKIALNKYWFNKNIFKNKSLVNLANKTKKSSLGRRTKESTEIGGHTAKAKDNLIDKCWRDFFKKFIDLCNYYSKPYGYILKKTNFKNQFGSSIIQNKFFINIKMYKYLTYDPPIDPSLKFHREFGYHNLKVIKEMLKKKNKFFNALMKLNIETVYNKYIKNDKNFIINGIDYFLFEFQTIDDVIKEKVKEKDEEDINAYKKRAINLINYIMGEGKNIMRKKEDKEEEKINYLSIKELD